MTMTEEDAESILGQALVAFRKFSKWVHENPNRSVKPGSEIERDIHFAGTDIIPKGIVEGLLGSIADHQSAWVDLVEQGVDEPEIELHLFADFTLLRPIIEALASIVWILGDERQDLRVKRALLVANAELRQLQEYLKTLEKEGLKDSALTYSGEQYEKLLTKAATQAGLNLTTALPDRATSPTTVVKGAGHYVPGPRLDTFQHWALSSANVHGQIVGVLTKASRTISAYSDGTLYSHAVVDTVHLAKTLRFIGDHLLPTAVSLLNKRGFRASSG